MKKNKKKEHHTFVKFDTISQSTANKLRNSEIAKRVAKQSAILDGRCSVKC